MSVRRRTSRRRAWGGWVILALLLIGCGAPALPTPTPPPPLRGDGLRGTYYNSRDWSGPVALERIDPVISFEWSGQHPVPATVFSVRWEGYIVIAPTEAGPYIFSLRSDDASWLYLDGTLVVDNGGIHTALLRSGQVDLTPGPHQIRIDYAELAPSLSLIRLEWRRPNGQAGTVPSEVLFSRLPATR